MNTIDNLKNQKVGDILNAYPHTKNFFEKYKIDYCCGGQTLLDKALNELNLNNETILNELLTLIKEKPQCDKVDEIVKSTDLSKKTNKEIIGFIINHFHKDLRESLPVINEGMLKIMRVHIKEHKDLLWKLHELLAKIIVLCESHLILEEEEIFKPMISFDERKIDSKSKEFSDMVDRIKEAINEHDIFGPTLKEIETLTNNYSAPQDVKCNTFKNVYDELKHMQEHFMAHTQVENNILFPRYLSL